MDNPSFILIPVAASILEVREHFRDLDINSPVTAEEMRYLTDLTYRLVPTIQTLEKYAEVLVGKPVLN